MKKKFKFVLFILAAVLCLSVTVALLPDREEPTLTENGIIDISSSDELLAMKSGKTYRLISDITLEGTIPSFNGVLDGNGRIVTVSEPMFDTLYGKVYNLQLDGFIKVASTDNIGALANSIYDAEISNISSSVTLSGSANGTALVCGGLVGTATNSSISKCSYKGTINLTELISKENGNAVGGLVGKLLSGCVLSDCSNEADLTTKGLATTNKGALGGLVGYATNSTIERSTNKATVSSPYSAFCVGGILGRGDPEAGNPVSISYCANYGAVTKSNSGGELAGGIVAYFREGEIVHCYNVSDVSNSNGRSGGIFGYVNAQTGNLTVSYNYNVGSAMYGIGYAKNDGTVSSVSNFYIASKASDGTPYGTDTAFRGNLKASEIESVEQLNTALLAFPDSAFIVDPDVNDGYAFFPWNCPHTTITESFVGNVCNHCNSIVK